MQRILVLSRSDAAAPSSEPAAAYLHAVLPRMAARGHLVVLFTARFEWLPWQARPSMESRGGFQTVRLGPRPLFPFFARSFLRRLARRTAKRVDFDAVLECVHGRPLPASDVTPLPVLPLVFELRKGFQAESPLPGPVAAASPGAAAALRAAGVDAADLVEAWPNAGPDAWDPAADALLAAIATTIDRWPVR